MLIKIARAGFDPVIAYAASELKRCLSAMDSTAEICILAFSAYKPELDDVLWLGVCPEVSAMVADPVFDDGFLAEIRHGRGAIRGTNARSVLLGVYRVLTALGCAWIRPGKDGEILPVRSLDNFDVSMREFPSYRHRAVCIEGAVNADHVMDMIEWLPRVGMNAYYNQFHNPVTFYDRWYRHLQNPALKPEAMSSAEIEGLRDASVEAIKSRGLLYHATGHGWTCEPFGIPGETWDRFDGEITDEQKSWMAEVNGVRDLWRGVTLNTNMCYSNPVVRGKMVQAITEYAKVNPAVDCLHVWLADGSNNHCECAECVKKMPSEWYVILLNEIDAALTAAGISTRIVFLIYVDLLWAPVTEKLANPDRFILMFAPITRSYSQSLADAPHFDEANLPAFKLNKLKFPSAVGENLAWLRQWQKDFPGDSFDFDYHFMWDHFKDPGYYRMAETLFRDAQNLHKVGLNGLVSCQCQRAFFPTGLGMHAMAAGLWSETAEFDEVAERYLDAAFGEDGAEAREYLRKISDAFDPRYLRREVPTVDAAAAKRFAGIPALVEEYREVIHENAADMGLHPAVRRSWELLQKHSELCVLLARTLELAASGSTEAGRAVCGDVCAWARLHERELMQVFDVYEFQCILEGFFAAI